MIAEPAHEREHALKTLRQLAAAVFRSSPRKAIVSVIATLALVATEGGGVLLLMPLLALVGVDAGTSTIPKFAKSFASGFAAIGFQPTLASILAAYVGLVAFQAGLRRSLAALNASLQQDLTTAARVRVYRAIAGAEWRSLVKRRASEFTHVLAGEIGQLGGAVGTLINLLVIASVSLVYLGLAFYMSPTAATLVLVCAAGPVWLARGRLDKARLTGKRAAMARRRLHAALAEHLAGMKTAKSYGTTERHATVFAQLSRDLRDVNVEAALEGTTLQEQLTFSLIAVLAIVVYVSVEILKVPTAQLLVLLYLFARLMPRMVTLYGQAHSLTAAVPVLDHLMELEQECLAAAEPAASNVSAPELKERVRLERVTFRYDDLCASPAVDEVTLDIQAGATTAIVGPSGAGKSTFADVLMGLLPPTAGRMLVDDRPLRREEIAAWRERIGYVEQDTFLFHDTIATNLRWARPGASDDELWQALRLAAADEFVKALPQGLDTVVGDRGVLVSGGERQRLSLARAVLRKPSLLILDEATSSLDSENELKIQRAVEMLHHEMTVVIITHRLTTVRDADVIHVLDRGHLIESGSWDQLLNRRDSRFRELCRAQGLDDRPASTRLRGAKIEGARRA